jgi:hypothetical protein
MRKLIAPLFAIAAVINFLPVIGVVGAERLESLYGMAFSDPNLIVLMRHRALLFGVVAGLLAAAVFRPALRMAAGTVGLISMVGYLLLAWPPQVHSGALQRVFWVDVVGCVALTLALWLSRRDKSM